VKGRHRAQATTLAVALILLAAAACASGYSSAPSTGSGTKLHVVAAENFWGSIAAQLGGDHVDVTEIINSPDVDPHDYEPTPDDARSVARARYVVVNGLGYDAWASDLVDANGADDTTVLDVGNLLGLHTGDNPHRWYFPDDVTKVIDRITSDYKALDPANAAYYDRQHDQYVATGLKPYRDLLDEIRTRYAGTPVGASENIVDGLIDATGLDMKTPRGFVDAIAEGNEPSASDKVTVDNQLNGHAVDVFIYNGQNATPDVQQLVRSATDSDIPVVTVTETPEPANATFQDWQTNQLHHLANALAEVSPG
jgi:zinc/manganese transport system substrate-binding protein